MVISYVQNTTHIPVSSRYVENEETVIMSYNSVTHDCWRGMPVSHLDEGHVKKSPYALKELNMKEFYSC